MRAESSILPIYPLIRRGECIETQLAWLCADR